MNTVRNIYLYHTQSNGWNDIAYNYVVAPDGMIFDGRDGKQYGDDNAKGAHFCGKNSGTMGICLLGNYNLIPPSDTALGSIKQLISWKLHKESLDPLGSFQHPANEEGADTLDVISGHRDGCSTECPGELYYILKDSLRQEVKKETDSCATGISAFDPSFVRLYPNPARTEVFINSNETILELTVFDLSGKEILIKKPGNTEVRIAISTLKPGIYPLRIITSKGVWIGKLVKE